MTHSWINSQNTLNEKITPLFTGNCHNYCHYFLEMALDIRPIIGYCLLAMTNQAKKPSANGEFLCSKCSQWKLPKEFNKDSHAANGIRPYCRACQTLQSARARKTGGYKEWYQNYYKKNGGTIKAKQRGAYIPNGGRIEKSFTLVRDTSGDYSPGKKFSVDEVVFGLRFSNFADESVLQNRISKYVVRGNELYTPRGRKVSAEEINP